MSAISCPICNAPFRESLHDGILIDICTQCRGVWLDRGELEKLLSAVKKSAEPYNQERDFDRHRSDDKKEYRKEACYEEPRQRKYRDDDDDDRFFGAGRQDGNGYRKRSKLESLFGMFD